MAYSNDQLNDTYDRTTGYCHLCHKKLAFKNYGIHFSRGAWEVEHSNPKSKGGTDRRNNRYAACIYCNRSKCNHSTRSIRARNGFRRAPLSVTKRQEVKSENAFVGGVIGALIGRVAVGPNGIIIGAIIGAAFGYEQNPDQ